MGGLSAVTDGNEQRLNGKPVGGPRVTGLRATARMALEARTPRAPGPDRDGAGYHWLEVRAGEHTFLRPLFEAFDGADLRVWTEATVSAADYDRVCNDGLITAVGEWDGRTVALVWSDFRVGGASYGRRSSARFTAFLRHLGRARERVPLVYVVNSAGLSIMEGRTAFPAAFGIWPELLRYGEGHLVLTCAVGKCLGLAPLLFGLGHYRVAVAGETQVNLTGPDVLRLFFGKAFEFDEAASAERCVEKHDLVHELVPSTAAALRLFRALIAGPVAAPVGEREPDDLPDDVPDFGPRTEAVLERFLDDPPRELVPGWCPRVRLFVGARRGTPLGVFVNPLERSNNLITVRTLEKYAAGLDLFRALRLPIISVLDSPGIDPRFDQSDAGNIRRILEVGEKIIRYPWGAMGVVAGRCYGGATTLAFPRVFGGYRAVALRDARVDVMDERIIAEILRASPRLYGQWRDMMAARGAGLDDLVEVGSVDRVIDPEELGAEVDHFLLHTGRPPAALPLRRPTPAVRSLRDGVVVEPGDAGTRREGVV